MSLVEPKIGIGEFREKSPQGERLHALADRYSKLIDGVGWSPRDLDSCMTPSLEQSLVGELLQRLSDRCATDGKSLGKFLFAERTPFGKLA